LRESWKAFILAAMSGFRAPPLPIELTVGAGLLAAFTLPSGVEELVMLAVTTGVDNVPGPRRGLAAVPPAPSAPGDETEAGWSDRDSGDDSGDDGDERSAGDDEVGKGDSVWGERDIVPS